MLTLHCICVDNVKYGLLSKHQFQKKHQHGGWKDLKICWFAYTQPGIQETCGSIFFLDVFSHKYIILAMLTMFTLPEEQSKLLVLSSASFFSCSLCFDFFYTLSSAQASLDCATLGRQINWWTATPAVIRNANDEINFQIWIKL